MRRGADSFYDEGLVGLPPHPAAKFRGFGASRPQQGSRGQRPLALFPSLQSLAGPAALRTRQTGHQAGVSLTLSVHQPGRRPGEDTVPTWPGRHAAKPAACP
jgi:hypothetical protein